MSCTKVCVCLFLLYYVFKNHQCLKVIPERAEVVYYDKLYFEDAPIFNVRRYSRKGDYVLNLLFTNKKVLDNTVSMDIIFYQYVHNEFRRSFPEFHFKLCDFVNHDQYFGPLVRAGGWKTCPTQPGKHFATNMSFNTKIPSVWPFEKGMVEFSVMSSNKALLGKGVVVATFKQNLLKHET